MKLCPNCKSEKDLSEFSKSSRNRDRLNSWCKLCMKKYYQQNKKKHAELVRNRRKERRGENRRLLLEYLLTHSCIDCGISDPVVLEFDHRDPTTKKFSISNGITDGEVVWTRILEEIEKCDVVCANCHRKRTTKQFKWFKSYGV